MKEGRLNEDGKEKEEKMQSEKYIYRSSVHRPPPPPDFKAQELQAQQMGESDNIAIQVRLSPPKAPYPVQPPPPKHVGKKRRTKEK